jgi:hypothetical protein
MAMLRNRTVKRDWRWSCNVGLDLGPGMKSRDPARETTMTTACAGCITSLILNKNRLCGRSLIVFLGSLVNYVLFDGLR